MNTNPIASPRSSAAFTLIEMLVVIAIIGLLIAIVVPVLSRGLEAGRVTAGLSNMRQIGLAGQLYALENKGKWPRARGYQNSSGPSQFFYTELSNTLISSGGTTFNRKVEIFKDPNAAIKRGENHFTMNRNLGTGTWATDQFPNPSQSVSVFDGAQVFNGDVEVEGWGVDGGKLNGVSYESASPEARTRIVQKGANTDTNATKGNIRWRNRKNREAKFLFLDGRVASIPPDQVQCSWFMAP
jgi:prepilin-type N-terminal cleavage/methylation domain-containing protein